MDLEKIDERVQELRKNGSSLEALELIEQSLEIRKEVFGLESEEVKACYRQLCEMCNQLATEYLQREDFHLALDLLKRAEALCGKDEVAKVKTLNNLACYYRQSGKLRIAQNYLQKALGIPKNLAVTHLNMCAVLSQMLKHEEALSHAMEAVIILQDELIGALQAPSKNFEEQAPMLSIAYHNMGVELEFLKRTQEAITIYKKAEKFAKDNLSDDHPLAINARKELNAAIQKQRMSKSRQASKKNLKIANRKDIKISPAYLSEEDMKLINRAWKTVGSNKSQKNLKNIETYKESSSESETEIQKPKTSSTIKQESDEEIENIPYEEGEEEVEQEQQEQEQEEEIEAKKSDQEFDELMKSDSEIQNAPALEITKKVENPADSSPKSISKANYQKSDTEFDELMKSDSEIQNSPEITKKVENPADPIPKSISKANYKAM
ncbi:unnamed protein product [Blepharisma stoltei]|uniref:Tetratricopeptide repeat protein n=1 Tax=Blepharisma stoltei TaxID=1481888 RepID=A0AAU9I842_9CILI|nr:unnamed protein product [Blepharisma stoltei]